MRPPTSMTRRSGSRTGNWPSIKPLTMLNTVVFAAIPRAIETTTAVKAGFLSSVRNA